MALAEFIKEYTLADTVSFHMPGHKGRRIFEQLGFSGLLDIMADGDLTEIDGADNLFRPKGVIREVMDKYRRIYASRESFLLVGGSSAGIIASVMTCIRRGEKLLLASNCHKSAINGLILAGGRPVYIDPQMICKYGISGSVSPQEIDSVLEREGDVRAVLVTSPNYYGICSDIEKIAETAHRHGVVLIVDEAHGAHLTLTDKSLSAEANGADVVVVSTHKTLISFTQTAVANIYGEGIDTDRFGECLQMIQSSSPSYILMTSLDMNADMMLGCGSELADKWSSDITWFYGRAREVPHLKAVAHPLLDKTKINLDMSACGLDGRALSEELRKRGIFLELSTGNIAMAMTGIGNVRADYERLLDVLRSVASSHEYVGCINAPDVSGVYSHGETRDIPSETEKIHYSAAGGRICAVSVIPYPPGIPLIAPGEVIRKEAAEYAASLLACGQRVIGMDDDGNITVGKL